MKILFFISSLAGGGAERVTVNLANDFVSLGHNVTIFLKENIVKYDLDSCIEILCPVGNGGKHPSKLTSVHNYFKRIRETRLVIKEKHPDVIVASYGCDLIHILLGHGHVPIVASEHNTFDRKHNAYEKLNRFYLNRRFDKVVVLTRYDKAYMARCLKNTLVIPNPLSFAPISKEEYENTFENRKNLLACGRLNAYHVKGFDTLIRCYAKLANKYPSWDLDIAGAGDEQSIVYLKKLAAEEGVENRVHFLGFRQEIATLMREHSIFVLSSRSEGFGMVITEAMAMGCPCVSFDLSGPSEIIVDTIDGMLVESQNEQDMVHTIGELIDRKEMRRTMGLNAINNVKRFERSNIAKRWITLFRVLKDSPEKVSFWCKIMNYLKDKIDMLKVLFDLESTQPNSSGKRHGGGKYGEIVLARIIDRGLPVAVYYDSRKWLNPDVEEVLKTGKVDCFDIAQHSVEEIAKMSEADILYTPQLSEASARVKSCKVLATLHGLRGYELPIDLMMLRYERCLTFRNIVKCYLLTLFPWLNEKRIRRLKDQALFKCDNIDVVTVSEHSCYSIKTFFPEMKMNDEKVFYSPSTVTDMKRERVHEGKFFLMVSGNRWEKNNLRAMMALDRLFSEGEIGEFTVVVTGVKSATAFKYKLRNPERFKFAGYVDDESLSQLYHDAYCLIYPSLNEGFGYPPLEAMANGVPVIASPFTSINEVCQNAALYTNPFSIEEIMSRILMITDVSLWQEYSNRGLQRHQEVKARQESDLNKLIDYIYQLT